MRKLTLLPCVAATLALAGCGGPAGPGDGPASIVPPDALVYIEAVVRPEGELRDGALETFGKVADTDEPEERLRELLTELADDSEGFDYDRDVKPWLGERAALWIDRFDVDSEATEGFGVIVEATDVDEALESVRASAERERDELEERSFEGTDYLFDPADGTGVAAVEDFLVIASEPELERTITTAGGDSLGESDAYTDAADDIEGDRLATFYIDQRRFIELSLASTPPQGRALLEQFFDAENLAPVVGGLIADGERVAIDYAGSTAGNRFGDLAAFSGEGTPLLGELPADAWVAGGIPDLGETARELFDSLAGALGGAALEGEFRQQTGLDLQEDVFSWIGDVAAYATGVGEQELQGAVAIEVTDAGRAESAFGKIAGLLQSHGGPNVSAIELEGAESAFELVIPDLEQAVVLARSEDRVVVAYGRDAATATLSGEDPLSDSDTWASAQEALGDDLDPALIVDMEQVLANVDAFGAGEDPGFAEVRGYLDAFGVIASGTETDDDVSRGRFAASLK